MADDKTPPSVFTHPALDPRVQHPGRILQMLADEKAKTSALQKELRSAYKRIEELTKTPEAAPPPAPAPPPPIEPPPVAVAAVEEPPPPAPPAASSPVIIHRARRR